MNRKLLIPFLVVLVLLFTSTGAVAQSPGPLGTAFTYQGQLKGTSGPVNGVCDMRFSLWDAAGSGSPPTGGAQVGVTQTVPAVMVTNDLFTTVLNGGNEFGSNAFTGKARWLQVAVRCPGGGGAYTTLSPRRALTAVPYALYAASIPLAGNGAARTAARSDHNHGLTYWRLGGNGALTARQAILGTTSAVSLTLSVNNTAALRLLPSPGTPNIAGGSDGNWIMPGVVGATISGGGGGQYHANVVTDDYGTVSGGYYNRAGDVFGTTSDDAPYATVGGGDYNWASGFAATVAGGHHNTVTDNLGTIGGGEYNTAADDATVAGGRLNRADGGDSAIGGGGQNRASGIYATIGGGVNNVASGHSAAVPGGASNLAQGDFSFAAGRHAQANHQGAFVWADSNSMDFASTGNDQFFVRASGGIYFFASPNGFSGGYCYLPANGAGWTCSSDRNLKENWTGVNNKEVLAALSQIPIAEWNMKGSTVTHIGPAAQDFYAAFGVGEDDTHINTVDAQGVALAAVQGLYQTMQDEIAARDTRIVQLEARLDRLEHGAPASPTVTVLLVIAALSAVALSGTTLILVLHQRRKEQSL
jgi:hypothetical protein